MKKLGTLKGIFLFKYDQSGDAARRRIAIFLWINGILAAAMAIAAALSLAMVRPCPCLAAAAYIIIAGSHLCGIFLLRGVRYDLSVYLLLFVYMASWLLLAFAGLHDFIATGTYRGFFLVFVALGLAGVFGAVGAVTVTALAAVAGIAAHLAVSMQSSTPGIYALVRMQSRILIAAVLCVYAVAFLIRLIMKCSLDENMAEQEKNLEIMHSLESKIRLQTDQLLLEKDRLNERNREFEEELVMACKIQNKLIPSESPAKYIHTFYKPMKYVGGDFFDFVRFRDSDKIGMFVSDVSGHGISAAFVTSMVKSFIMQSRELREDPKKLLHYLNELLINQIADIFVTAIYGIYEPSLRRFTFSSAGHNSPFCIYRDRVELIKGQSSIPLAVFGNDEIKEQNMNYVNNTVMLPEDCQLLIYTDGLTEERNGDNLQFQHGPMIEALLESRKKGGHEFIDNLVRRLFEFSGSDTLYDDLCLIYLDV